ncbi:MAG: class I SAM-dependent methyltransferase [Candidatus Sulfotelmatobacter sp.]
MRILDVGCGTGRPPWKTHAGEQDSVMGIDSNLSSLVVAKRRFPERHFVCCQAEALPFSDSSFGRVVSSVAMPYTDIPVALAEIRHVLVPGGSLFMSVHHLRFTLGELRAALPNPIATLYRLYVLANGLIFHASGRLVRFPNGKVESFQTTRALERALGGAGFVGVEVSQPDGKVHVDAKTAGCSSVPCAS